MKNVLIIGAVWPEPDSSAAGVRMMQLIDIFASLEFKISFASIVPKSDYMVDLSAMGIDCYEIELNNDNFDVLLASLNPDVVLFDRFITEEQFGWKVSDVCPSAFKILDTEDLHFLRRFREKNISDEINLNMLKDFGDTKRELLSILRCDLSLLISNFEYDLLINEFGVSRDVLCLLDFPIFNFDSNLVNFSCRKDFCFIGNFHHKPNVSAVRRLKKIIWPKIQLMEPNCSIFIYGAYPTQEILQFNDPKSNFYVVGRVPSSKEVLRKHIALLAPLDFGAGIKGKVVDSLNVGLPVITTKIGIEGLGDLNEWGSYLKHNDEDFANMAIRLHNDQNYFEETTNHQMLLLRNYFSGNNSVAIFKMQFTTICDNLNNHRNNNYLIKLLNSDTINSKKYMSKWIFEKNNNK